MNQLRPVFVSLEFDATTPTKRINKQIIEPKNNKTPRSPALTKSLQMINTEKTNPIPLNITEPVLGGTAMATRGTQEENIKINLKSLG